MNLIIHNLKSFLIIKETFFVGVNVEKLLEFISILLKRYYKKGILTVLLEYLHLLRVLIGLKMKHYN